MGKGLSEIFLIVIFLALFDRKLGKWSVNMKLNYPAKTQNWLNFTQCM